MYIQRLKIKQKLYRSDKLTRLGSDKLSHSLTAQITLVTVNRTIPGGDLRLAGDETDGGVRFGQT